MNKTAIKNFAVWARNKLIADITYRAGLVGVSDKGIAEPLPQSSKDLQFFDIGTKDYAQIAGKEVDQRKALVKAIQDKEQGSDYATAFKVVIEEVAYTWFNRLIAIRFMEVNDYLPSRVRVLSSENQAKNEPDFVTTPFDTDMEFTSAEQDTIMQLKDENKLDDLFRMLFIKQCNKLHEILPELFENTNDYTELLLSISFTDCDGIVYHLVHDIDEDDFNIEKEGQVEIIGWMYQYYNIEPKDETFALLKKNVKITKERIPAATQLFTPDWIVRYMVENSLGRLWVEGHPNDKVNFTGGERGGGLGRDLKSNWKYYLEEAEQEADVQAQLEKIRTEYRNLNPEDIKVIDPCMGSGHILVYCFDVLMQIYESQGYTQRDAAQSILENNLFGLDIDKRAAQLSYFAVMMKARQYDRRIFGREIKPHVYVIEESNDVNRSQLKYFGAGLNPVEKNSALNEIKGLLDTLVDAKEYGSILNVDNYDWDLLRRFVNVVDDSGQMTLDTIGIDETKAKLCQLVEIGQAMAQKYDVVVTNPPYMGANGMEPKLVCYLKDNYSDSKSDFFAVFIEKCMKFAAAKSFISMITMESWMFLSSYEKLRTKVLNESTLTNMTHMPYLGKGGTSLGISFGTTAFIARKCRIKEYISRYNYIRYYETDDNGVPMEFPVINERYSVSKQDDFSIIPGSPIAYWVGNQVYRLYKSGARMSDIGDARQGLATGDNGRFMRSWYEVEINKIAFSTMDVCNTESGEYKWFPYNKGGEFRKWYGNQDFVVNWERNGFEIRNFKNEKGKLNSRPQNMQYYFKPCCTWSLTNSSAFGARIKRPGFIFDINGMSFFTDEKYLNYILGYLCSNICSYLMKINNPTFASQAGDIAKLPIIIDETKLPVISELVSQNIEMAKKDWDSKETSWDFTRAPLLKYGVSLIEEAYDICYNEQDKRICQTIDNEAKINRIFEDIYGIHLDERIQSENTLYTPNLQENVKELISYAVGCMFGRYSLDTDGLAYAGGEWDDSKYSIFIPDKDNCIPLTDEPYFEDDIVGLFCAWLKKVYGEDTLEENLDFIAKTLSNKGSTSREVIRNYFLTDFFKDHCGMYSVTGSGKRPIYWLFDSGKQNGFKALVYMHRWDADTVGNLRVEYLHKTQRIYEREIQRMQETMDNSHDSREINRASKRKEKLQKQLKETKDYDTMLAHIALSRIDINLDDGVKVNYEKVQTGRDGKKMQILAKM